MLNKRYAVINHEYYNTGGNCMVSTFTVFDKRLNMVRYILLNDEGLNLASVDFVSNDDMFETDEERDSAIIGSWALDDLRDCEFDAETYELFKYCQFEFYKENCRYFNRCEKLPVDELPKNLFDDISPVAVEWHRQHDIDVETNGYEVFVDVGYLQYLRELETERELQDIKDFKQWHDGLCADGVIEQLYGTYYTISVGGNSVKVPFGAGQFNHIVDLLDETIQEW